MARGHDRERAVKRVLEGRGWLVIRAAGSKVLDLVAIKAGFIWLVEVKSTAKSPWEGFGPADRKALSLRAKKAGGCAILAYWPPRGELEWIPEERWP